MLRNLVLFGLALLGFKALGFGQEMLLDGLWQVGEARNYQRTAPVPGLAQDPALASPRTLWYQRSVQLPPGDWSRATLTLKGARFAPVVYVDGKQVSSVEGGMAPTIHRLDSPAIAPGRTINLEIALQSLTDIDPLDASATPGADRWRTNISSGLWDSVELHCSGPTQIARMTPWTDFTGRTVAVHWTLDPLDKTPRKRTLQATILTIDGQEIARSDALATDATSGIAPIVFGKNCQPWSPDSPQLYRLRLTVAEAGKISDQQEIPWGLREFKTQGLGFLLNGDPVHLRAATVVWPRFLRDPEAKTIAFDPAWFEKNIINRLQSLGANTLRFHLGLPPESFLDLCDRHGLMVQLEWSFFHGIAASPESLRRQWRSWLDVATRHPSVVLLHPWNETAGEQLVKAKAAIADVAAEFPPLVISHRDVLHVHKYWWSLFENLGLYYDSASDFPQPVMADEFGGNYLDRQGNEGGYPTVHETFLRFVGRDATRDTRLQHHAEANAQVAEYWRRLGVAGFSPFCILGSPQDGNGWFLGPLANPEPMPVWAALSAAFSPQSVSLELWNRNFRLGEKIELPLTFFNDRPGAAPLDAAIRLVAADGKIVSEQKIQVAVPAFGTAKQSVALEMPKAAGEWRIEAQLLTPVRGVTVPIQSTWRCRTLAVVVPDNLAKTIVGVPADELELRAMLEARKIRVTPVGDPSAQTLVFSTKGWQTLSTSAALREQLEAAVARGQSVVLLDMGPSDLERYQASARSNLDGAPVLNQPRVESHRLFAGIDVVFREVAEPESHLHPAANNDALWKNLPLESTWLWNGLRGGLLVATYEMDVLGLSSSAFLALWEGRGADPKKLAAGDPLFAYELSGYYAFAAQAKDETITKALRSKVKFLVEDAPSLQGRIDLAGPVVVTDLAAALRAASQSASASDLTPLASCGKGLTRIPAVLVGFGPNRGRVVLSQLLTAGRLVPGDRPLKTYELGYDPAAEQLVLNLIYLAGQK